MDNIKPGYFINDRYEIIDKVGSGGMADVYKAKCHSLNRYVAIKILKSQFSSDTNFVTRFKAEAQSVAGFSHPNVVGVYDVGDDDELHYIVMELVEGITLKRFIERKQKLEVKDAVGIAIQICQALEVAHNNHVIHRDIKPQNIIISRDGKVKVADFGIAKVVSGNTYSSHAIGSVHYLSPEMARGGFSDERSDIYSLGVTLYEMLTGQVPFTADNTVSVALLHLQGEATPIQTLNPDVPNSVELIVEKCMQKKPERRYQSATELIADLKRSISNPDGDYINIITSNSVNDSPTRSITAEEMDDIKKGSQRRVEHTYQNNTHQQNAPARKNTPQKKSYRREDELDQIGNPIVERVVTIVSIIAAIGLVILIIYLVTNSSWFGVGNDEEGDTVPIYQEITGEPTDSNIPTPTSSLILGKPSPTPVPTPVPDDAEENLVMMVKIDGLSLDEAVSTIKLVSKDLQVQYKEEYNNEVEKGVVFDQEVPQGTMIPKNSVVQFSVSSGGELFELEDVSGKSKNAASKIIKGYKLNPVVLEEYSKDVAEGDVIRTEPEGGSFVAEGDDITIYVSLGEEVTTVSVPSLLGMTKKEAKSTLEDHELSLGNASESYSDAYAKGLICGQSISAGEVVGKNTVINYTVSLGSEPVVDEQPVIVDDNSDEEPLG